MKALLDMIQANKELTAIAAEAGLTIRDLMYDQARLLAQDAIKKIPPGGPDQGSASQKKAGIEATKADISEMFWGIQDKAAMRKWDKQLIKTGGEMMIGTKQGRKMIKSNRLLYNASLSDIRDKHLTWRNKKGNVQFPKNADEVAGGKYIVEKRLLNKYIKAQIKKVGNLKAGFIPAGRYFEALSGKSMKGIAGWIQKQEVKSGTQVDAINKKTGVGYAELINMVSYSDVAIPESTRNALMRTRQRDIERQAKKRLKKLEKEHNDKFVKAA